MKKFLFTKLNGEPLNANEKVLNVLLAVGMVIAFLGSLL